jgi:YjbE family integral membrane protein
MELFSMEFLSALAAIVVIDLVLAGDNAIVIALAARNLPAPLRRKAIIWGTFGAVAVRSAMTLAVVWLLKIPGLLLVGGALLIWIAYKLLVDDGESRHEVGAASGFWSAMKTIVVADALMGLDNVLGVAGAAQGSFLLVVLGLLISIPIVVWGSQLILKWVERYSVIVYVGAGVLAWTAVTMMISEPFVKALAQELPLLAWVAYAAVIGGVLACGFRANRRKVRARVAPHLVDVSVRPVVATAGAGNTSGRNDHGGNDMMKILIPVDGSDNSLKAVRHSIQRFLGDRTLEIHLLHVRTPLTQHAARFISRRDRAAWHREEADKALEPARALLQEQGVPFAAHVELGDRAATIDRVAQRLRVNQIVMGTARQNSLTRLIEDSVTSKVLALARVPVEVVVGDSVSKLERMVVPAGIGAAVVFLLAATD